RSRPAARTRLSAARWSPRCRSRKPTAPRSRPSLRAQAQSFARALLPPLHPSAATACRHPPSCNGAALPDTPDPAAGKRPRLSTPPAAPPPTPPNAPTATPLLTPLQLLRLAGKPLFARRAHSARDNSAAPRQTPAPLPPAFSPPAAQTTPADKARGTPSRARSSRTTPARVRRHSTAATFPPPAPASPPLPPATAQSSPPAAPPYSLQTTPGCTQDCQPALRRAHSTPASNQTSPSHSPVCRHSLSIPSAAATLPVDLVGRTPERSAHDSGCAPAATLPPAARTESPDVRKLPGKSRARAATTRETKQHQPP